MARPARFSADDILDAATRTVLEQGTEVTMAQIARAAGAPTGSIYHRFASREELLIRLWLRSMRRFHTGFLRACRSEPAADTVVAAAVHVVQFCREHPADAYAMTLYRHSELLDTAPPGLREEIAALNEEVDIVSRELVYRRYRDFDAHRNTLLHTAMRLCPHGMVQPFVGGEVPDWLDDAVAAAAGAIAALGD